jgi:hypothetical protein
MTEERICPIMSRPYIHQFNNGGYIEDDERLNEVACLQGRCMAWKQEKEDSLCKPHGFCKLIGVTE